MFPKSAVSRLNAQKLRGWVRGGSLRLREGTLTTEHEFFIKGDC